MYCIETFKNSKKKSQQVTSKQLSYSKKEEEKKYDTLVNLQYGELFLSSIFKCFLFFFIIRNVTSNVYPNPVSHCFRVIFVQSDVDV